MLTEDACYMQEERKATRLQIALGVSEFVVSSLLRFIHAIAQYIDHFYGRALDVTGE